MVAGTAVAVVTVAVAVLATTQGLPGGDSGDDAADAPTRPPASAAAPGEGPGRDSPQPAEPPGPTGSPSTTPTPTPTPTSPSPTPTRSGPAALPPGFQRHHAPEGFSVALPKGWERLDTDRQGDLAYRVVFGADGDDRTLAVTYSARVGPDPVAVWRDDVEPHLRRSGDYERIGGIRATTYQGREAADMEWTADGGGTRVHTFGRGFLLGGGRSFSLRWTTPDADWKDEANQKALRTVLATFRPGSD